METSVMEEGMEIDYTSFYSPAATVPGNSGSSNGQKKESGPTRTGQVIDMMNPHNLGTTFFRLIPDKVLTVVDPTKPGVPRLYRKVVLSYAGRIQDPDNNKLFMNVQIPRVEEFLPEANLTQDQKNTINALRAQAKNFCNFTTYKNKGKFTQIQSMIPSLSLVPQSVYAYGKLIKIINSTKGEVKNQEIGHVRIFKFSKGEVGKTDFITVLNNSLQNKVQALGSSAWMKDYFSRAEGEFSRVLSVNVGQSTGKLKKYSLGVTLEEMAPFTISKEDLDVAGNLNSRVFDITKFDEKYYERLTRAFANVQAVIDSLSK